MISEVAVAMSLEAAMDEVIGAIHHYPTVSGSSRGFYGSEREGNSFIVES